MCTNFLELKQSLSSIGSHSCKENSGGVLTSISCCRSKKHIYRWPMAVDQGAFFYIYRVFLAATLKKHMVVTWCYKYPSLIQFIPVFCFFYFKLTNTVKTFCKRLSEALGHMLHYCNTWHSGRQFCKNLSDGLCPSCGSTKYNNLFSINYPICQWGLFQNNIS